MGLKRKASADTMGLKRKASALELDAFSSYQQSQWPHHASFNNAFQQAHQPSSPPSLTSDSASPASSPSSMDTEPFHTLPLQAAEASYFTHTPNAPWLHTRTRKRIRDNRPSDAQIHDATMRRLFDAQRAHHNHHALDDAPMLMMEDGSGMMMDSTLLEPAILPQPTLLLDDDHDCQDMQLDEAMNLNICAGAPEANQRSIHDFFARQKGKERECVPVGSTAALLSLPIPMPVASSGGPTIVQSPVQQQQHQHQQQELKERRSFGVLGDIANRGAIASMAAAATVVSPGLAAGSGPLLTPAGGATVTGSCLPCDFRPAEVVHALMEDAMVMG